MTDSNKSLGLRPGVSRRAFLQGSGAVAAATALQSQATAAVEEQAVVSGETTIELNVNGEVRRARVEPRTTLLDESR